MPDVVQVGPLFLKTQWLVGIGALLVGYVVIGDRLKVAGYRDERVIQTIENGAIIALVVWKFSGVIFDPAIIRGNPMALLYFTGGVQGVWLAAAVAVLYFYLRARAQRVPIWVYADLITVGFLAASLVYHLLDLFWYHQMVRVNALQVATALILAILAFRSGTEIGDPVRLNQMVLWFSLAQIAAAFLNPLRQRYWLGFSRDQLLYAGLAALALGVEWATERRRLSRNA